MCVVLWLSGEDVEDFQKNFRRKERVCGGRGGLCCGACHDCQAWLPIEAVENIKATMFERLMLEETVIESKEVMAHVKAGRCRKNGSRNLDASPQRP